MCIKINRSSNLSRGSVSSLPRSTRSDKEGKKKKLKKAPDTIKEEKEEEGSQITDYEGSDTSNPNARKPRGEENAAGHIEYGSYVGGYQSNFAAPKNENFMSGYGGIKVNDRRK